MPNWKKLIVSGSDATLNQLNVTTAVTASNLSVTDTATYNTVEFTNSNIMKFNQRYTGGANGSYFTNGEYQKVVTITPSADSENYQVVGRMTAQNAGETHTVYFNAALRSETLPNLAFTTNYEEEYNGGRYLDPQLWVKETATAGFIVAFKTLATIYGSVTIDFDVIPRAASQKANVTINQVTDSEQTSIDSGFTAYEMERNVRNTNGNLLISGSVTADSFIGDGSQLTGLSSGVSSYNQLNGIPSGIVSSSAQTVSLLSNQDLDLGTGHLSASNIQIEGFIRHTGDSNTFISMSNDHMSFTAGNQKFIDYHEAYNGTATDDRFIINPDKGGGLDFYLYGDSSTMVPLRTEASSNRIWIRYDDDESGNAGKQINKFENSYYEGVNIRTNVLFDNSQKLYFKHGLLKDSNTSANIFLHRVDTNIGKNEVLGGIIFAGDDSDAPISGSTGFAIQARATANWASGSYPSKLVFYSGKKGHENWPDQGIFRIDPDGKTNIGSDDDPQELLWVSGSIESYVKGSHISASRVLGESITGSFQGDGSGITGILSASYATTASYALNSDGSGFPFSGSAIITGSLIVSQSGVEVTGSVNVSGSVTATEYKVKNGVGTPTLTSGNSIIFSGSEAAIFKGLSLRLESFENSETGSLTSQDGDVIYNSDRDKIMFYSASTWRENLVKGDAVESASYATTASHALNALTASFALNAGAGTGFPFSGSALITGSLLATTFISASSITGSFSGDGSGITGITIDQSVTVVDQFSEVDTYTVEHGFDTQNLIINVFDENNDLFLPERVRLTDNNNIDITFATASSGKVVVAKGGHIVSGSQEVSEIATLSADFSGVTFVSASHNFNTRNIIVQVYDENNYQIIPNSVELPDLDTAVIRFTTEKSGSVVIAKGGHIISSSISFAEVNNIPTGLISASGTTYTVSGSLVPSDNESFDLGTSSNRWRDLYLSGSSIYLDNTRLKITGSGDIEIIGHNGTRRDFLANSIRIGNGEGDLHLSKHSDKLLLHHTSSTAPLEMIVTASHALTASFALNAAGDGFPYTGSAQITGSLGVTGSITATTYYGDGSNLSGVGAGSVVETATVVDNFSSATSHTATHNFNTKNVIVQVFNSSDELIIPSSIIANTVNTVRVTFPEAVTGRVVVAKGGHLVSGSGGGGGGSSAGILKHAKTLTDDITIEDNYNALLISPVSFDCTVSVSDGADLHIISF